jgi:elongation factor G
MRVADLGIMVVSAVEGVEVQHEILWKMAEELKLPRLVFVNKLERERASFNRTLDELNDRLGGGFAPLELALGDEHEFHGVVDVLTEKAFRYEDGKAAEEDMDEDLAQEAQRYHTQIVESVAESDDALLERYLEGDTLSLEEVVTGVHKGLTAARVFPVVAGSATKLIGIDRLADMIVEEGPAPLERRLPGTPEGAPPPDGPMSAFVFKTVSDPYVGRISLFRVMSGTVRPDASVHNVTHDADERIGQLFTLRGKAQEHLSEVPCGDIGAVAKLGHTHSGDSLAEKGVQVPAYPPLERPDRALAKAITPKTKGDEDKLMTGLARLQEEDPALEVEEIPLRIPYRETIARKGAGLGRHVKQSGGHGQYGVCTIEIEPTERGAGFEFVDKIFGGAIPNQFIPSVQKGVERALSEGVSAGYPFVDVRVTLLDGKYHTVDSSDMAFQIAGALAFREAAANAGVCLLEPIMDLEVIVPDAYLGDIMGDLNSRRGRIQGTESLGGRQAVQAKVPMSEVARYAVDLRSMTGGQGTFKAEFSHYEEVPSHLTDKIVAEAKEAREHAR